MHFTSTTIHNAFLIDLQQMHDDRGFFARSWCKREFEEHGLNSRLVQCNVSFNLRKGTLRGMHYQAKPFEEAKVMQCTKGSVYVAVVDIRANSPTCDRTFGVILSAENRKMLYVPEGCANGYLTLEDNSEIYYQMSEFYSPESYRGFRWDDPRFPIAWPSRPAVISDRDRTYPDFKREGA